MLKSFLNQSWVDILDPILSQQYFKNLCDFVHSEYKNYEVYPPKTQVFKAFQLCRFDKLKVVIIGQDPYPNVGQANGLCFSVNHGVAIPKSLTNIFNEIKNDIGYVNSTDGDLSRWAQQGVFLLNSSLTVRAKNPGSHFNHGWEVFTDTVIDIINKKKKNIVYLLWGAKAIQKASFVDMQNNLILTAAHPSPLSAHNGFFGCKHFSKTNTYLQQHDIAAIDWT